MSHDLATVAAYLAGELTGPDLDAFERHLLTCDTCWAETQAGRRGQELARQAAEPAPAGLRARLHHAVRAADPAPAPPSCDQLVPTPPRRRVLVLAAVAAIVVAAAGVVGPSTPTRADPVAAAVTGYADNRLPGAAAPPADTGPDLSGLGVMAAGAGAGQLAGQPVHGYAYQDTTGRRVFLYLSDRPFPMPSDANRLTDEAGAWTIHRHHIVVLCARTPHEVLIVGTDPGLVHTVATTLALT